MGSLNGRNDKRPIDEVVRDNVFGPVPSQTEVEKAISELQSVMDGNTGSSSKAELNQLNKMVNNDSRITQSYGYRRFQDACHLMKTKSSVQKMVASIASDKAVWHAVLSNKAVQDLGGSLCTVRQNPRRQPQISVEEPDIATLILKWILGLTMAKFGDLMVKFGLLVKQLFDPTDGKPISGAVESCEETVKSSFLLSLVILLIVVITRIYGV